MNVVEAVSAMLGEPRTTNVLYGNMDRTPLGSEIGYRGGVFKLKRRGFLVKIPMDLGSSQGAEVVSDDDGEEVDVLPDRDSIPEIDRLPDVDRQIVFDLEQAIDQGADVNGQRMLLPKNVSVEEHYAIAKDMQSRHASSIDGLMNELQRLAPQGEVAGRVKTTESILGKLVRKPKYGTARSLQDTTGTRIVHDSINEVLDTVAKIKSRYDVIDEDDYITEPNGDYRSYHLIIKDDDGLEKEVQVRTENQNAFAEWAHDIYKPVTPDQEQAIEVKKDVIQEYSEKISTYFYLVDTGRFPGPKPSCPEVVVVVFGCL